MGHNQVLKCIIYYLLDAYLNVRFVYNYSSETATEANPLQPSSVVGLALFAACSETYCSC